MGFGLPATATAHAYFQILRDGKTESNHLGASTFTGPAFSRGRQVPEGCLRGHPEGKAKFTHKADNGWLSLGPALFRFLPGCRRLASEDYMRSLGDNLFAAEGNCAGGAGRVSVPLYAVPAAGQAETNCTGPRTGEVDYGWLTVIAADLLVLLELLHKFLGNWGLVRSS